MTEHGRHVNAAESIVQRIQQQTDARGDEKELQCGQTPGKGRLNCKVDSQRSPLDVSSLEFVHPIVRCIDDRRDDRDLLMPVAD